MKKRLFPIILYKEGTFMK